MATDIHTDIAPNRSWYTRAEVSKVYEVIPETVSNLAQDGHLKKIKTNQYCKVSVHEYFANRNPCHALREIEKRERKKKSRSGNSTPKTGVLEEAASEKSIAEAQTEEAGRRKRKALLDKAAHRLERLQTRLIETDIVEANADKLCKAVAGLLASAPDELGRAVAAAETVSEAVSAMRDGAQEYVVRFGEKANSLSLKEPKRRSIIDAAAPVLKTIMEAEALELDLKYSKGRMRLQADVRTDSADASRYLTARVLGLTRLGPALAVERDADVCAEQIQKEIDDALCEYQRLMQNLGAR